MIKSRRIPEARLLDPPPDSALARARDFGIDLTLLAARLNLTPEARLDDLQRFMNDLETARADARTNQLHSGSSSNRR